MENENLQLSAGIHDGGIIVLHRMTVFRMLEAYMTVRRHEWGDIPIFSRYMADSS